MEAKTDVERRTERRGDRRKIPPARLAIYRTVKFQGGLRGPSG
jgi:hypothetical protein